MTYEKFELEGRSLGIKVGCGKLIVTVDDMAFNFAYDSKKNNGWHVFMAAEDAIEELMEHHQELRKPSEIASFLHNEIGVVSYPGISEWSELDNNIQ